MPKFVLIDHSITEVGGHYYEYAVRVLRAAEEAGYEPVLATNRKLHGIEPLPWQVVPVYRYDFFQPGPPRLLSLARQGVSHLRHRAARLKYRWLFSRLGVLWSKRRERAAAGLNSRRLLVAAAVFESLLYVLRIGMALLRVALAVVPLNGYVRSVARAGRHLLAALLRPWRALLGQGSFVWQQSHCWRKRSAFGADSVRLFRKVSLQEDDVVFIPTLTEADMLGLLTLFRANRDTAKATWHLVFRRNIYQGRDTDYAAQDETLRPLRNAFRQFQAQLSGQRVYFYTDTEPLTVQYNRLGVALFRTASIPVAADYRANVSSATIRRHLRSSQGSADQPFHVVYIGDARTEKGYHWLPHLVGDAFATRLPARFTFQSNFNVPGGEPAPAVARAQLEALPAEWRVELQNRPLVSDAYRRLLLDADVVVIPYDRDNYYARSSGIFAEALVAGKPVIVPAGTWMASELSAAIYDYHQTLRGRHPIVASFESHDLVWKTHVGKIANHRDGGPQASLPILGKSPTYCWVKVPANATHLLLSFKIDGQARGVFPGIVTEHVARGRAVVSRTVSLVGGAGDQRGSALVCIGGAARRIRVGVSNSLSTVPIMLSDVRIDFLSAQQALPSNTIGAIYAEPNELSQHLREILVHYDHYQATAAEFSRAWSAYHSPQMLLEQLVGPERLQVVKGGALRHENQTAENPAAAEVVRRAA